MNRHLDRIPALVFACLIPGELRVIVHPGVGLANGGIPRDIPIELVPMELRMPNTLLWLQVDGQHQILKVWKRDLET